MRVLREHSPQLSELLLAGNRNIKNCQNMQIAKPKVKLGSLLLRLDLQYCLKGDEQVFQLSQSSYLKDLQYLNIRGCKLTDTGFSELLQSKSMRSLAVLIVRDNKIKQIVGPFADLEEATEKQLRKGVMNL